MPVRMAFRTLEQEGLLVRFGGLRQLLDADRQAVLREPGLGLGLAVRREPHEHAAERDGMEDAEKDEGIGEDEPGSAGDEQGCPRDPCEPSEEFRPVERLPMGKDQPDPGEDEEARPEQSGGGQQVAGIGPVDEAHQMGHDDATPVVAQAYLDAAIVGVADVQPQSPRGRLAQLLALVRQLDGVLLDLGVSSPQLDDPERGFSFLNDGPLDMRMDPSRGISAAEFVNTAPVEEIARVFKEYGEERFSGRMARAVVERRDIKPFERTGDLAEVLKVANPAWEKGKNPATRAFQGLRIHVNNELGDLEAGLDAALEALEIGGRLVVISFHSLEDRIVKLFMRKLVKGESDNLPRNLPVRFEAFSPKIKVHGKAQFAGEAELKANPRSRSAVMRVAEKLR